jgi:adenylate cyclase
VAVHRKLVAVVMADVVGYSRLMERDEAGTHARLRELREQLVDPKIAEHGGRIVNTSGDGMLLEFPSATSALRCAVEIQREMERRNAVVAADDRLELRIGVNLGDIIVDGHDIAGDGVNIAARLESLAEPGGICVASAIRDQVHEDLDIAFVDAGERQLKNISKPVRVFNIALDGKHGRTALAVKWRRLAQRRWVGAALAGVLIAVASVAVWRAVQREPAQQTAALDTAPWGTVLVLPFASAPEDPALAVAAARLTTDITSALGDSLRKARVIPAVRAAAIAGESSDPQEIGRKANARYLIGGDLRPSGSQLALMLRLIDTDDARQIASARKLFDRAQLADTEPVVRALTSDARVMVANAAIADSAKRSEGKPPSAQGLLDRAYSVSERDDVARAKEQRRLVDEALKLDPQLARAWALRADIGLDLYFFDFSDALSSDRARVVSDADADSLQAVSLDPLDPPLWITRGKALAYGANPKAARAAFDKALELDPTRFGPIGFRAMAALMAGEPDETLKDIERMHQAYGKTGPYMEVVTCQARLALGAYDVAIPACERGMVSNDTWIVHATLAAAYALSGDTGKAAEARAKLLKLVPGFTVARYEARRVNPTPEGIAMDQRYLIPGLRKAGVPD